MECVKHERDGCSSSSFGERIIHKFDDKIEHVEANSDDDDDNASFHSFCDSQTRLSNVSATSVGEEIKETHPTAASNIPPPPPPPPLLSSSLVSMKSEEDKAKTPSPSKHVLEPKRLHNITILSKALNVTTEQVCAALIQGEGLSLQDLEALLKMVPTKEEEAKLANYKGDTLELGHAQKPVKAMIQIPSAFARIESMHYRETFEDELLHLKKSFSILEEACKELRSSRDFLSMLDNVCKELRASPRSPNPLVPFG
ncbi:formin-like protein 11 [Salvia splendens]|uniref:formin-like protein 11 n=1 Tax=Salvia splendens TaxID=180675 RepID=UPI001C26D04C|nr:formin-like protein 11 [Salvia splendens]